MTNIKNDKLEKVFFKDTDNIEMCELVNYFQEKFSNLANSMKDSNHAAFDNKPNQYHIEDSVWTHTMMVCLKAEYSDKINMISALLHDIGKPLAREVIEKNAKKPEYSESNVARNNELITEKSNIEDIAFKTHFRGHEGLSTYMCVNVLKDLKYLNVINEEEMKDILTIVSLHGTLFDNIKNGKHYKEDVVKNKWYKKPKLFEKFVQQVKYDSTGRFFIDSGRNAAYKLGDELFGSEFIDSLYDMKNTIKETEKPNTITVLVGVPNSGKSTWVSNSTNNTLNQYSKDIYVNSNIHNTVIISRDDTLMNLVNEHRPESEKLNYSDSWKLLTDDDQKEIDKMILNQFNKAIKAGNDIIIDMTNTSKKSRKKWLNNVPKSYKKIAQVFITDFGTLLSRNEERRANGKYIPMYVLKNMCKSFTMPMYDEVDDVNIIIS